MSSHTIEFSVNGGNILSATSLLTADSVEYVKADFTFDQSWAEHNVCVSIWGKR